MKHVCSDLVYEPTQKWNEYSEVIVNVEGVKDFVLQTKDKEYTLDFQKLLKDYGVEKVEVLDADGVPINVGDTIWNKNTGKPAIVLQTHPSYVTVKKKDYILDVFAEYYVHYKPDTQDKLNEDVLNEATELSYLYVNGVFNTSDKYIRVDKVEEFLERQRKIDSRKD